MGGSRHLHPAQFRSVHQHASQPLYSADPLQADLQSGVVGSQAKFYPICLIAEGGIDDDWQRRTLYVTCRSLDGVPHARWVGTDEEPMQLLTRWYGFSFTYPNCEIYDF